MGQTATAETSTRGGGMIASAWHSVLFESRAQRDDADARSKPDFFADLNLDQIVSAIIGGKEEYRLASFFHAPVSNVRDIEYRHEVFRDLDDGRLLDAVESFARGMHEMRGRLAQAAKLRYRRQKRRWFLGAVFAYCDAVMSLAADLDAAPLGSRGLRAFHDFAAHYASSSGFKNLAEEARAVARGLASVKYNLRINGSRIRVTRYDGESDYSADVAATFEKFRRGEVTDYLTKFNDYVEMNHVEAGLLDRVALLFPDEFAALDAFCNQHADYLDEVVASFDREIQFYVAYLRFIQPLKAAGLPFCYPRVHDSSKQLRARDTFDLALANKLVPDKRPVVCNDLTLADPERIIVVSGPNQGGKTTFARTFAQLHYLAKLGLPVPGEDAELFLYDELFTHFERQEAVEDLSGKLQTDLMRMRAILDAATPRSLVIMNEIFTSTTLDDAISLGTKIMRRIIDLDLLCVCVTFVEELASLGESVVSMVSTVAPDNPAERTFKVVRRRADGLSYAAAIADKHGLSYERLKKRLTS